MSVESIAVFCGSASGDSTEYVAAAKKLGMLIATKRLRLIFGGGNVGLMGAVSNAAVKGGAEVVGVIPERIAGLIQATPGIQLHVVPDMHRRKEMMYASADAFVALPGGIGTLEEAFEVCTWNQLGYFSKPLCFVNINEFFKPLFQMLKGLVSAGFLKKQHFEQILIEPTVDAAVARVLEFEPQYFSKL